MIRVRIGELELSGIADADRAGVAEALQAELGRLFAEGGVPSGFADAPGGPLSVRLDRGSPAEVGREVARAIYGRASPDQS